MKKFVAIICVVVVLFGISACLVGCGQSDDTIVSENGQWRYKSVTAEVTVKTQEEADAYVAKGYEVVKSGKKITLSHTYYSLVAYLGNDANVVVPATVDDKTIEGIEDGLFLTVDNGAEKRKLRDTYTANNIVETVVFEADIEEIPALTFYLCEKLTSVQLPAHLKSIGDFAFFGCKSLASIAFPQSLESIGEYAFRECSALKTVAIHNAEDDEFPPLVGDKCFYLLDKDSSDDDQYYVIPDLKITVDHAGVFDAQYIKDAFKANKNNDYRNWLDYIGEEDGDACYVYDATTQQTVRNKEAQNG